MTETGIRWVFNPRDSFAHVLADPATAQSGTLTTICGRELPTETTPTFSVRRASQCLQYADHPGVSRRPPQCPDTDALLNPGPPPVSPRTTGDVAA